MKEKQLSFKKKMGKISFFKIRDIEQRFTNFLMTFCN